MKLFSDCLLLKVTNELEKNAQQNIVTAVVVYFFELILSYVIEPDSVRESSKKEV